MNKRIVILGHFGGDNNYLDGQTVKTKTLYEEIKQQTDWEITIIDTFYKKERPISLFLSLLKALLKRRSIIVLLSGNGMQMLFPILYFFSKLLRINVFHDVIGGNLDEYIVRYPVFEKYLNSFSFNFVETELLSKKLKGLGIKNSVVIPNFKRLDIVNYNHYLNTDVPLRFCTFSRVMREKGILDAINAINSLNNSNVFCTLDIYGPIEKEFENDFNQALKCNRSFVNYMGVVPYENSVSVLRNYYALLFPTFWDGEGFPGTIIDAYSSGVPVIATRWNSNEEIVEDKVTGLLYPSSEYTTLEDAILWIIKNKAIRNSMSDKCIEKARCYSPDNIVPKLIEIIERKNGWH